MRCSNLVELCMISNAYTGDMYFVESEGCYFILNPLNGWVRIDCHHTDENYNDSTFDELTKKANDILDSIDEKLKECRKFHEEDSDPFKYTKSKKVRNW